MSNTDRARRRQPPFWAVTANVAQALAAHTDDEPVAAASGPRSTPVLRRLMHPARRASHPAR